MNPEKWGKYLAVGFIIVGLSFSGWRVLRHQQEERGSSRTVVIRLAHWQLEPGVREAIDAIAHDYMKLHPHVRIEQMPIPGRVWQQWLRTQLVGGTPPDLIELANYNVSDEMLARYFVPLTPYLAERNPYDAAEPDLRDLPWRKTFAGELVPDDTVHYYSANLLEYYGVPNAMVTVRIFYNRDIIKAATGADRPPQTFEEFIQLCKQLQAYARHTDQPILPLAGSTFNITKMTGTVFSSITQKLVFDLDYAHELDLTKFKGIIDYLRGRWSLDTPAIRTSLATVESIGRYMPAGWVQLNREDSMLQFVQGRAAMLSTGTWDAGGILQQAQFKVGAFKVPAISLDDPVYGKWTLGPISEANIFASLPFGLTRTSKHQEQAIDFLRFMTSRESNTKFARISTWLPVIKGVPVPKVSEAFRPVKDGYIPGLNIQTYGGMGTDIFTQHIYLLSGKDASVDAYVRETRGLYRKLLPLELERMAKIYEETIRQKDSVLPGLYALERAAPLGRSKFDVLAARQIDVEAQYLQAQRALDDYHQQRTH